MRTFITLVFLLISMVSSAQIVYNNWYGTVYSYSTDASYDIDINSDGEDDIRIRCSNYPTISQACNGAGGNPNQTKFIGHLTSVGRVKLGVSQTVVDISPYNRLCYDCNGYIVSTSTEWDDIGVVFHGIGSDPTYHCQSIGVGIHYLAFRLILINPITNLPGYKYGYLIYELVNSSDIIVHGWYYEDSFNTPITANGLTVGIFSPTPPLSYQITDNVIQVFQPVNIYDLAGKLKMSVSSGVYELPTGFVFIRDEFGNTIKHFSVAN